ncbi:hypothetical protein Scep_001819 [Stephania cephalantha]|uniref:FLZ-type domain-containing protein n=1 Tax=Stephania cephalantha TaxID=152367 RepID=A0AAP0Q4C6_9MAGN
MLLGKRPRPPIRRTTSITEFAVDPVIYNPNNTDAPEYHFLRQNTVADDVDQEGHDANGTTTIFQTHRHQGLFDGYRLSDSPSSAPRRHSADFLESAHFLIVCGLCKRRLAPTRDIYMYKGDTAFCSLDCRRQQMNLDELKEKCSLASNLEAPTIASATVETEDSNTSGTVVTAA